MSKECIWTWFSSFGLASFLLITNEWACKWHSLSKNSLIAKTAYCDSLHERLHKPG